MIPKDFRQAVASSSEHLQRNLLISALVMLSCVTSPAEAMEVTIKEGNVENTLVTMDAVQEIAKTTSLEVFVDPNKVTLRELVAHGDVTLSWEDKATIAVVRLFARQKDGLRADPNTPYTFCGIEISRATDELTIKPYALRCKGDLVDLEAILEVEFTPPVTGSTGTSSKKQYLYLKKTNQRLPSQGSDMGIALTMVQPLKDDAKEGFKVSEGVAFYYAWSRLKNDHFRAIAQAALLDFVADEDFEVGLGVGGMFRTNGFASSEEGLGIVFGIGYNLMVDTPSRRAYNFVGVSLNFGRDEKEEK